MKDWISRRDAEQEAIFWQQQSEAEAWIARYWRNDDEISMALKHQHVAAGFHELASYWLETAMLLRGLGDDTCSRTGLPHAYWPQGQCQYCGR